MTEQDCCKIFVIDNLAVVREGLKRIIDQEPDMMVCGEAEDAPSAMNRFINTKPDLVVIDISLSSSNRIDLIKGMRLRYPDMPILVFSLHQESIYAERALRAGASGYVMKSATPGALIDAIRKVRQGKIYLSEQITGKLLNKVIHKHDDETEDSLGSLSDREFQVFQLIGKGVPSRQIAPNLNLSIKTIGTFRENIKRKLGLNSSAELAYYAIKCVHSEYLQ